MENLTYETERQAKENLMSAFQNLRQKHSSLFSGKMELEYGGNSAISHLINNSIFQIDALISKIQEEERSCANYLQRYCPKFYSETSSYRVAEWLAEATSKEEKDAKNRIMQAVHGIDEYVMSRSQELANSFMKGLKRRYNDLTTYGIGRPWGTEIRQRLAVAIGLKDEVNSLWTLGLNSIANSQKVDLGEHFIDLIKKDDAMKKVRKKIDEKIVADIKSKANRAPLLTAAYLDGGISASEGVEFGGKRNKDDMLNQLKFTLQHPIESMTKYADTWNVAMNELTWSIRHGTIFFNGIYHAVYNVIGFAYLWEIQFNIEDTFDLRPHNGSKLNFSGAYDIVTSILGTVYHDLFGNTDNLKVRAHWNESEQNGAEICKWS